jgi:hypothetical protein
MWRTDPLLDREIETDGEYSRCYAISESTNGNGSINTSTTIAELLKPVFSVGVAPRLYNEDPRPAELITKRELRIGSSVQFSSAWEAVKSWRYS